MLELMVKNIQLILYDVWLFKFFNIQFIPVVQNNESSIVLIQPELQ